MVRLSLRAKQPPKQTSAAQWPKHPTMQRLRHAVRQARTRKHQARQTSLQEESTTRQMKKNPKQQSS
eukprot:5812211-Amphidinium_carterae.1